MKAYDYQSYDDIPENIATFVKNVACLETLDELSITDVNIFLNELEEFYNGTEFLHIEDFIQ